MILVDCEQGSLEWLAARRGLPTASEFGRILTPGGKASRQADDYLHKLLAEWLSGETDEGFTNYWMQRGFMLQPEAISFYQVQRDVDVEPVGFCLEDGSRYGCSPDGLVGEDGGLEIKCPSGGVHLRCLMTGEVPSDYWPQVQGSLLVTGREWWDFTSYHPKMPSTVIRVQRDEPYLDILSAALDEFCKQLEVHKTILRKRGFAPVESVAA